MANANTPFGLKPLRGAASEPHSGGLEMFHVPASDATALYIGDPVVKAGSSDAAGIATVARAVAAGPITGVVQGFVPDGTTNMVGYRAASTAAYVLVNTNPDDLYEIQDTAGTIAAADIGLNANMTINAGNAYSKRSGVIIDPATKAATATLALKIVGVSPRPGNEAGTAYQKLIVKINNSTEVSGSAGV
jgi:hypothetical protein